MLRWSLVAVGVGLVALLGLTMFTGGERKAPASVPTTPPPAVPPSRGEGLSPEPRPSGHDAEVGGPVDRMMDKLNTLVQELLYSNDRAVAAGLRLARLVEAEVMTRESVTLRILGEIRADSTVTSPRLRNPAETARCLLEDISPSPAARSRALSLFETPAPGPEGSPHRALRALLAGWPPDPSTADSVRRRAAELKALVGNPEALAAVLERALRSGNYEDRMAVLAAARAWAQAPSENSGVFRVFLDVIVRVEGAQRAVDDLFHLADAVHAASGLEETPHPGTMALATNLALFLQGKHGKTLWDQATCDEVIRALTGEGAPSEAVGGTVFLAVALGGAVDGNPSAIDKLAEMYRDATTRLARNTALVNLGAVTDLRDLVKRTGMQVDPAPQGMAAMLTQADFFAAVHNAVTRHPENQSLAEGFYRTAITSWRGRPETVLLLQDVVGSAADLRLVGLKDLYAELAQDPASNVSVAAERALKALESR